MSFNNVLFHFILFLISNWHCALPCCQAGFHQLSVYSSLSLSLCFPPTHVLTSVLWLDKQEGDELILVKIASRAGAKNRRIYKGRRLSEAPCTYAAVAGKDETLRETERERERERERLRKGGGPFSLGPASRRSLSQERQKWHVVEFFSQPGSGCYPLGVGAAWLFPSFLNKSCFFPPLQLNKSWLCCIA